MRFFIMLGLVSSILVSAGVQSADAASRDVSILRGRHTESWTFTLKAGVSYRIIVDGDGDSDLDTILRDEGGHVIDSDLDSSDYCVVTVTPKWSGPFSLEVKNVGRRANRYQLSFR